MAGNLKVWYTFDFLMNDINNKAYRKIKMDGMIRQINSKVISGYGTIDIPHGTATSIHTNFVWISECSCQCSDIQGRISISNQDVLHEGYQPGIDRMDIKSHVLGYQWNIETKRIQTYRSGSFRDESWCLIWIYSFIPRWMVLCMSYDMVKPKWTVR